jgi:hypothetical protein
LSSMMTPTLAPGASVWSLCSRAGWILPGRVGAPAKNAARTMKAEMTVRNDKRNGFFFMTPILYPLLAVAKAMNSRFQGEN